MTELPQSLPDTSQINTKFYCLRAQKWNCQTVLGQLQWPIFNLRLLSHFSCSVKQAWAISSNLHVNASESP